MFFIKRNRAVQKNLQREEKQQSKRKTQGRDSKTKTKLRKLYNLGRQMPIAMTVWLGFSGNWSHPLPSTVVILSFFLD